MQLWGPRYSTYVVDARDAPAFTLGRLPESGSTRRVAESLADRLEKALGDARMIESAAAQALGEPPNRLRYATLTGRVRIRWDGAKQPTIWIAPPPGIGPGEARLELARRYLHVFGPATPEAFAAWAGISSPAGVSDLRRAWSVAAPRPYSDRRRMDPRLGRAALPSSGWRRRARAIRSEWRRVLPLPPARRTGAAGRERGPPGPSVDVARVARRAARRRRHRGHVAPRRGGGFHRDVAPPLTSRASRRRSRGRIAAAPWHRSEASLSIGRCDNGGRLASAELPPLLLSAASCRGLVPAILGVLWIALAAPAPAWPQAEPRGVLLINAYNLGYEWTDELTRGVRAGLEGHDTPIDLSVEFLDARRRGEELFPQMRALLQERYSPEKTAVIIAADDAALKFLLDDAPDLLRRRASRLLRREQRRAHRASAAQPVHRRARGDRCRAVSRSRPLAAHAAPRLRRLGRHADVDDPSAKRSRPTDGEQRGLQMIYLDGRELSLEQVLATLRARHDAARPAADHAVHARSHGPVVHGARISGTDRRGLGGADLHADVDRGGPGTGGERRQRRLRARPDDGATRHCRCCADVDRRTCRVETFSRVAYQFDYRQLARCGIDESRLPAAAVIVGRPRSFYGENQALIWTASLFIVRPDGRHRCA